MVVLRLNLPENTGHRFARQLAFGVVFLGVALLSGCIRPKNSQKLTLRIASSEVNAEQRAITEQVIADFEKAHPNVDVECEFGITPRKILVQIAGGVGPDLFSWWYDLQPLISRHAVKDLAPLAREAGFDWGIFYPAMVDYYRRGDAIYSMPVQMKTYCLIYNKDLFDKAGEPYPDGTWDWEKYLSVAQRMTDIPENGPARQFGNGPFAQYSHYMIRANGGDWFHRENGRFQPDTPENRRGLELMVKLWETASPRPEDNESFGGGSMSQAFLTGKIAMQIAPAWMMAIFQGTKIPWSVTAAPHDAHTREIFDDAGIAMNAKTKYPREAFALLQFYTSRQMMEYFASCRNGLAARQDANKPFVDPKHPGMQAYLDAAEKATTPIKAPPDLEDPEYYHRIISTELERVYPLRQISIDEFFRRIESRLNQPKPDIG